MAIEGITAIQASDANSFFEHTQSTNGVGFSSLVEQQLIQTDNAIAAAEEQAKLLALGEAENLHQVMIALSKAKTSFDLTVQIRNKALEGFQEILRMQL